MISTYLFPCCAEQPSIEINERFRLEPVVYILQDERLGGNNTD